MQQDTRLLAATSGSYGLGGGGRGGEGRGEGRGRAHTDTKSCINKSVGPTGMPLMQPDLTHPLQKGSDLGGRKTSFLPVTKQQRYCMKIHVSSIYMIDLSTTLQKAYQEKALSKRRRMTLVSA